MMMAEYIERERLLMNLAEECDKYNPKFLNGSHIRYGISLAANIIKSQLAADVAEVRHGKWVNDICSVCGRVNPTITEDFCGNYMSKPLAYCTNCGAKMDGGEK